MSDAHPKLDEFMEKMLGDLGTAFSAVLVVVGDKLGLYKALADSGPATPAELAERTATDERYVREWLAAQAAAGYVDYDREAGRYRLNPEQEMVFADSASPVFAPGAFEVISDAFACEPKITNAFRTGSGVGWEEHTPSLFRGTERFFRPAYAARLVSEWIPALEGVQQKLESGARVADVGCGHGSSTVLMAQAFPSSRFTGFDFHPPSIERAREAAAEAKVLDRVRFEVAAASSFPGSGYDLVTVFDCLHDMGDPAGAAAHVREALDPDGTWMIVEPFAHDGVHENLNPVGRLYYAASTMICTPASRSQEVGLCLGAQAGERRLFEVIEAGGFTRIRRATETPFNLIIEARP